MIYSVYSVTHEPENRAHTVDGRRRHIHTFIASVGTLKEVWKIVEKITTEDFLVTIKSRKYSALEGLYSGKPHEGMANRSSSLMTGFNPVESAEDATRYWDNQDLCPNWFVRTLHLEQLLDTCKKKGYSVSEMEEAIRGLIRRGTL